MHWKSRMIYTQGEPAKLVWGQLRRHESVSTNKMEIHPATKASSTNSVFLWKFSLRQTLWNPQSLIYNAATTSWVLDSEECTNPLEVSSFSDFLNFRQRGEWRLLTVLTYKTNWVAMHLDGNKPKLCIVTVLTSRSIPGVILSLSVLMLIESILGEDRWRMSSSSPHEHVHYRCIRTHDWMSTCCHIGSHTQSHRHSASWTIWIFCRIVL